MALEVEVPEARLGEPALDLLQGEAQPGDAQLLAHPLVLVGDEVHHHDHAARLHDPRHLADRLGGGGQVVDHHVGQRRVHLGIFQRQRARLALAQLDAGQALLRELGARGFEHARRVIDRDHPQAQPRELGGQDPGARADVGDDELGADEPRDGAGAQRVVVEDLAQGVPLGAHGVEEAARARGARLHHAPQRGGVALGGGIVAQVAGHELPALAPGPLPGQCEAVEDVGPVAAVPDQARLAQDRQVPRHARLRHPEHVHQLLDRQLLALEQRQDPHPRGIRERLEHPLQLLGRHPAADDRGVRNGR